MYLNHAGMDAVMRHMSCPIFEHEIVAGDIISSVARNHSCHVVSCQDRNDHRFWNISAFVATGATIDGKVQLPEYYTPRQYAYWLDTVCLAVWFGDVIKVNEMLKPLPIDDTYERDLERLAQMCFIPHYAVRNIGEDETAEDRPGIRFEKHTMVFNLVPDSPEVGLAHFAVLDRNGNEFSSKMFMWAYDTEDIVAFHQAAYMLLAQTDITLSDRLDMMPGTDDEPF